MTGPQSRYSGPGPAKVAPGWTLERLTAPSRLFGANGLRTGPDGRIYVAQVSGSQISAIDIATGAIEAVSPMGGAIVAPDDLAFDDAGNIYATEITEGRVSMMAPDGTVRVVRGDVPVANPITFEQGMLIAGECRVGGRIMVLDRDGGAMRTILEDVPLPNAFAIGPDGKLYFPVMGTNQIWRVSLDGGAAEVVASDLGVPVSVKFDSKGFIVSTQVASGEVLRIDPRTGERTVLAQLSPGLDNCTFVGDRLFVSNITGYITEILGDGKSRDLVPDGLNWPLGLAVDDDGTIFIGDGAFSHLLVPGGARRIACSLFSAGTPGYARGVAAQGGGAFVITTATGAVMRFWPAQQHSETLASGFDQPYGVAVAADGTVVFAELGTGRVHAIRDRQITTLATGLNQPRDVAIAPDGTCYVSETGAGRVVKLVGGRAETVADDLDQPHGVLVQGDRLLIVDAGAKTLIEHDLVRGVQTVIATNLPVGAPPGIVPKFLGAIGTMSGPMGPLAAIAEAADGTLYLSADAEGSVMALRRQ